MKAVANAKFLVTQMLIVLAGLLEAKVVDTAWGFSQSKQVSLYAHGSWFWLPDWSPAC
jgi:hypothetical protein